MASISQQEESIKDSVTATVMTLTSKYLLSLTSPSEFQGLAQSIHLAQTKSYVYLFCPVCGRDLCFHSVQRTAAPIKSTHTMCFPKWEGSILLGKGESDPGEPPNDKFRCPTPPRITPLYPSSKEPPLLLQTFSSAITLGCSSQQLILFLYVLSPKEDGKTLRVNKELCTRHVSNNFF